MARVKTLYVRDEDAAVWEAAAKAAAEEGVSVSEYAVSAVRERLERRSQPADYELLSADSLEPFARGMAIRRVMEFEGRWILKDVHSRHPGAFPADVWSIAITRDESFVVHVRRRGSDPLLAADPDFGMLERKFGIPADIVEAATRVLISEGRVVRRDI
jgi:hypothetical protein